ncbi:MAG: peptidoglycan DD-metalloendopeptidase family protein [Methylobacter sp.]|nr:peptidoglycan DD-metalloendopeptidase family protein [Methylobacter sp.]
MKIIISKLIFICALSALLNACTSVKPNYAPVSTPSSKITIKNIPSPKELEKEEGESKYHQVKKGDTLYAISVLYDLDYRQLAQWNQIAVPYKIEAGQKIKISEPFAGTKPQNTPEHADVAVIQQTPIDPGKKSPLTTRNALPQYTPVLPNRLQTLTEKLTNTSQNSKIAVETPLVDTQKKSIISIDNEVMLKLNFRWPIKGRILKDFSKTDNKGIDIAGELGQDVSAAEAGKVVYSGQGLIGYGQLLIIKHNDLFLSAYANNSRLLVVEGNAVEKGQIIAKVGQAGTNKTALHFEIRKKGKPVNPLNFLPENQ